MTIKGDEKVFRLNQYEVSINPINSKQLGICVIDSDKRIQFAEQQLKLEKIGTQTLILALKGARKQISITPNHKNEGEFELLQLIVRIESPFLKTIQESIFIKKFRDVDEREVLDKKLKTLGQKLKDIKDKHGAESKVFYSFQAKQQSFNGAGYDPVAKITLKKGKYLLNFSFQLKATNQWLYLYLGNGQATIIQNAGYYVPTTSHWMPFTIRVVKEVTQEEKEVTFTTYCANSYPVQLRNRIITAQQLEK